MRDWLKYDKGAIFRDKSKNGLLFQFLQEYKEEFGGSVNAGCHKCLERYYNNYVNSTIMSTAVKCDWTLHLKYNGMQIGANGQPIRNGEMTNKIAKELHDWHPNGDSLFSKMPAEKTDDDLTLAELRAKYPDITANSKAKFLEKI